MPVRVQELIHKWEEGVGSRYLKLVLAFFAVIAGAVAYDLAAFRNLSTPEGMEAAQLAWNIAEGRGYTTWCIRPFSVHLLMKKHLESEADPASVRPSSTNTLAAVAPEADPARLKGPHPDLANPPVYPVLLAGFFKVIQMAHPDLALQQGFRIYLPDLWIGIFNQCLLLVLAGLVFFLARRLFDEPAAWTSAVVLLGAELVWRFTLSGTSTILLMIIFLGLVMVLAHLEPAMREGSRPPRTLVLWAAAAGALAGLGGLTRYGFGWLIIPVVLWLTSLVGPRRATLAMTALGAFLLVVTPWLVRNYTLCGAPFGTTGFAIFENTPLFPEGQLERSLNPDFSLMAMTHLWHKLIGNGREMLQNALPRLGGSWISAFFLVGLLVPFRSPTLGRMRWFLLLCLAQVFLVQALARTAAPAEESLVGSDNLLVVLSPLVFIYGVSLFLTLFEQVAGQFPGVRFMVLGAFYLAACAPLVLSLFPPYPSSVVYPPYYPPWIQEKAGLVEKEGLIMSDVPWAVAWYGQRQCIGLTLKHRGRPGERHRDDFFAVDALKPVSALYLTARTLRALEPKSLWDWLEGDADAGLLNRLRRRVLDNQGREEKKEEDLGFFSAVRERLVANAHAEEEKGEDWEHFVLRTFLKSEVPTGFPLRRAPEGLFPELFLTDSERGRPKTIQSSK